MGNAMVKKSSLQTLRIACTLAGGLMASPWLAGAQDPPAATGVVVDEVNEGSALHQAGLEPGDVVLSWQRLPHPDTPSREAQGKIESVFAWMWLAVEQAPRGPIRLEGQRNQEAKVFDVAPGSWQITVRPRLPRGLLRAYEDGKTLIASGEIEPGIDAWREMFSLPERLRIDARWKRWLLFRIGGVWTDARQWEMAQEAYRSALEETQDSWSRTAIWRAIGVAFQQANDFEAAGKALSSALAIQEQTSNETLALARSLSDLGTWAWAQRKLDSAQTSWQRALRLRQKLAPGSPEAAQSLSNLGGVAFMRGDLARAASYAEPALEIRQRLAPGSLDLAGSLGNLGAVAYMRGDLARAAESFEAAIAIERKLAPESLHVAGTLINLGSVAHDRGELARARESYEAALEIQQKLAPGSLDLADLLNNLGFMALDHGDLKRAASYHAAALEIRQELAPNGLDVARSLTGLGLVAFGHGDLAGAVESYEAALEIGRRLAPDSLTVAAGLDQLAIAARARGNLVRAVVSYQEALQIQRRIAPGSAVEAKILHGLAGTWLEKRQPERSLSLFRQALQILESQISRLGGSRDAQAGFRASYAGYFRDTLDLEIELGQAREAFHTLERSRAQSFLSQLTERDLVFSDVPEELDSQRRSLALRYDQTQNQIAHLHPKDHAEEIEALQNALQQLRWQHEDLTEEIIKTSPKLGALRYPQPLDFDAAREALDPGTVMLSYSVSEKRTHLFVLARDEALRVETIPIPSEALSRDVETILALQVKGTRPYREPLREAGERLYRSLIQPAEAMIANSNRVLIVPDGPLHLLPFALLIRPSEPPHGERDFEYLVEWKPLHSALSATVYAELGSRERSPAEKTPDGIALAAFGDPYYPTRDSADDLAKDRSVDAHVRSATRRGFDFSPLPYTREEIASIAALYPTGTAITYLGTEATEEQVKSVSQEPRILHFATHGSYDDRMPMNSFLALTIPETFQNDRDNGLLQAWEIFEDVRFDADLVVLSACESGVGGELDGEGLIGLTRAFQFAGARTVAASLWQVDDRATAQLMTRFYRHLASGLSKDRALRAAQLELIQGPIAMTTAQGSVIARDLSLPYYWAAFQMIGDWQ